MSVKMVPVPEAEHKSKPDAGLVVSRQRDDFEIETGRIRITPEKMGRILRNADVGDTELLYEMFSAVEEDPHVHAVLSKRRRAVTARKLVITTPEALEGNAQAERSTELCRELILGKDGAGGIPDLSQVLHDLTDAIGKAFALSQIVWSVNTPGFVAVPVEINRWPQNVTIIGDPFTFRSEDPRFEDIRILTDDAPVQGELLEPDQWIQHVQKARSAPLHRAALLRMVSWWYMFKHSSARDWAIAVERYGMPMRLGKYPPAAGDDERSALKKAVIELGRDAAGIMPEGSEIELIETKLAGVAPHETFARYCDEQISKAILGNTLTTEATARGARALGEVHATGEQALADDDSKALALTIRRDLCGPIVRFNVGPDAPVPDVRLDADKLEDLNLRAERDTKLVKAGLPVPVSYFYETYGIPAPAPDDELVSVPTPPSPFGGAPEPEPEPGDERRASRRPFALADSVARGDRIAVAMASDLASIYRKQLDAASSGFASGLSATPTMPEIRRALAAIEKKLAKRPTASSIRIAEDALSELAFLSAGNVSQLAAGFFRRLSKRVREIVQKMTGNTIGWITSLWPNSLGPVVEASIAQAIKDTPLPKIKVTQLFRGYLDGTEPTVAVPETWAGTPENYHTMLTETVRNRTENATAITEIDEAGWKYYRIQAVIDDRTSDQCRELHGTVFKVSDGLKHVKKTTDAKTTDALKEVAPWRTVEDIRSIGSGGAAALARAGLASPPYHANCRTIVVEAGGP